MALLSVADALARVLDGVEPLPREDARADRSRRPGAGRRCGGAAHPAAGRPLGHGRLCGARRRCGRACRRRSQIVGEVAAGRPFEGEVAPGEAARIFTGGVVPPGADTIVIQENTTRDGDRVVVNQAAKPGRHIRRAGLDFRKARCCCRAGERLTDRDVMLAAAMSHPTAAGASPAQGRGVCHRRRAEAARQRARSRRDRLFQRLCADGAGARAKARRSPTSASCRTRSRPPVAAIRRARDSRRRRAGDDRRRFGRRLRPGSARAQGRGAGACRSGGWRCAPAGR